MLMVVMVSDSRPGHCIRARFAQGRGWSCPSFEVYGNFFRFLLFLLYLPYLPPRQS